VLAMRLVSPAGYMPQWRGNGFSFTLCNGIAAEPLPAAHHHKMPAAPAKSKGSEHCPYAAASSHVGLEPVAAAQDAAAAHSSVAVAAQIPSAARSSGVQRPQARAPPLTA